MKILMVNRADALNNYGGDTTQMLETQNELQKMGQDVDVVLGSQSIDKYKNYDIIHLFNLQTAAFTYNEALKVRKAKKPLVLSTIWWDFYEDYVESMRNLSYSKMDLLRERLILNAFKLNLRLFVYPKQKRILKMVDLILPNSNAEVEILRQFFRDLDETKVKVVQNGVSRQFLLEKDYELPDELKELNINSGGYALQVGRIETGKNVLSTIKACKELNIPLVLIGKEGENKYFKRYFSRYIEKCKMEAGEETHFLGPKNINNIIPFYKHAKIHVLPSIRETPGLTSLEAGTFGCNIVTTKIGSTKEYFEDLAFYCDPNDYDSIKGAIMSAWEFKGSSLLKKRIKTKYNWKITAKTTLNYYIDILRS